MRTNPPELPLRVLMTADTVGRVFFYAAGLARALGAAGAEVALCVMGAPLSDAQRTALGALPGVRVYEGPGARPWMSDPAADAEAHGAWLLEVAARTRPHVVHVNDFVHGGLAWPAPVLLAAHAEVCAWFSHVRGEPAPPAWDGYRRTVRAALDAADAVVAPTRAVLDDLHRCYGPVERAHVVPHGRHPHGVPAPLERDRAVLAAGRVWDAARGLEALARVAPRLAWPVRIAGPAGAEPYDNVEVLGSLPPHALAHEMARAAVFALPARYEPFGLDALEAGLAGCALVLGDVPSLREVWGDAALYAADEAELERALTRLIEDAGLRVSMGARARRRARRFTPERMVAHYLRLYHGLAEARVAA